MRIGCGATVGLVVGVGAVVVTVSVMDSVVAVKRTESDAAEPLGASHPEQWV